MVSQVTPLRRISSNLTFAAKFILPIYLFLFQGLLIYLNITTFQSGPPFFILSLAVCLAVIVLYLWTAVRIKRVLTDGKNLYISSYRREIRVPLDQIADVTQQIWPNRQLITIHLKSPSEFGQKIRFLGTFRLFNDWKTHPIVDELKQMAGYSTYKEIPSNWLS